MIVKGKISHFVENSSYFTFLIFVIDMLNITLSDSLQKIDLKQISNCKWFLNSYDFDPKSYTVYKKLWIILFENLIIYFWQNEREESLVSLVQARRSENKSRINPVIFLGRQNYSSFYHEIPHLHSQSEQRQRGDILSNSFLTVFSTI